MRRRRGSTRIGGKVSKASPPAETLIAFSGAGHEVRGREYYHDARRRSDRPHVVLQLTLRGQGFYRAGGGGMERLPTGSAFLDAIPGDFEYGWHGEANEDVYEHVFIAMRGGLAYGLMRQVRQAHGPVLHFGTSRALAETMLALEEAAHSGESRDAHLVSGQLYGMMMQVLSLQSSSRVRATPLVERAIGLIGSRAASAGFNVVRLAGALDCSREHLGREFRRATAMTPLAYLTRERVRLAAAALRGGEEKLEALAPRCGFGSVGYLCRVFRRVVGVTPGQFRERPWIVVP